MKNLKAHRISDCGVSNLAIVRNDDGTVTVRARIRESESILRESDNKVACRVGDSTSAQSSILARSDQLAKNMILYHPSLTIPSRSHIIVYMKSRETMQDSLECLENGRTLIAPCSDIAGFNMSRDLCMAAWTNQCAFMEVVTERER